MMMYSPSMVLFTGAKPSSKVQNLQLRGVF
jgi:hypothetical protein